MKGLDCLINNASVFENDNLENFSEKLLLKEDFPFDPLTEEFSIGLKSIKSLFSKTK